MYTVALVVLLGLVSQWVVSVVSDIVPLNKIPFIGKDEILYALSAIGIVWLTDTSVLGTYGIGATDQWIDVVGSGLAVATASVITDNVLRWFAK
jgi:ABC-type hemin transport system substrate-binding protein